MGIILNYIYSFPIEEPWPSVLVVGHVNLGASDNNFCFVSIKLKLVLLGILTDNVKTSLEPTGRVSKDVAVICYTDNS